MNAIVLAALLECLSGNADCTIIESERTALVTVCGVAPSAGDKSHIWRFVYKGKPHTLIVQGGCNDA